MAKKKIPAESKEFLDALPADLHPPASRIRDTVLAAWPDLQEAIKWKRLTFTLEGNWHHWICAIGASKRAVTLYFHKGVLLTDPTGLLSGDGKYTRSISAETLQSVDAKVFKALMKDAVSKQTLMLDDE